MISILKIIGVVLWSLVLCLSLSDIAQARQRMGPDPCADRKGGHPNFVKCDEERRQGIETIKGEVLSFKGDTVVVERFDGKVADLHIDQTTKMGSFIGRGDRVEAKAKEVNDERHLLSIRQIE